MQDIVNGPQQIDRVRGASYLGEPPAMAEVAGLLVNNQTGREPQTGPEETLRQQCICTAIYKAIVHFLARAEPLFSDPNSPARTVGMRKGNILNGRDFDPV